VLCKFSFIILSFFIIFSSFRPFFILFFVFLAQAAVEARDIELQRLRLEAKETAR
jgi:hypothetical protein